MVFVIFFILSSLPPFVYGNFTDVSEAQWTTYYTVRHIVLYSLSTLLSCVNWEIYSFFFPFPSVIHFHLLFAHSFVRSFAVLYASVAVVRRRQNRKSVPHRTTNVSPPPRCVFIFMENIVNGVELCATSGIESQKVTPTQDHKKNVQFFGFILFFFFERSNAYSVFRVRLSISSSSSSCFELAVSVHHAKADIIILNQICTHNVGEPASV